MLGFSTQHKKNDEPTPDEHIPLVRLDDSSWTHGFSVGEGDKVQQMEAVARSKDAMLDDMESAVDRLGFIASTIRSEVCILFYCQFFLQNAKSFHGIVEPCSSLELSIRL
mmetsp:Transcript_28519/g.39797  ORF Transcript_28519/g.39797 Transcript_28519/m.39797 type:complete len:110 (+) Transcript_28519:106-435(+)